MKLSSNALRREVALSVIVPILGAVVVSWFFVFDPFDAVDDFLAPWLPGFRSAGFSVFGNVGQTFIAATVVLLIAITPFLIFCVIGTRQGLENAAKHSRLIPTDPQGRTNGDK